ncbi:gluconate 5-dehydrogenase [Cladophialophora yegresii CBS 114405]|uniref:Gluconate 5-dehydrogenase n=1 Tax=Cladophialophora yegresii CBS 114405 TaxID=1182544 RepID=W9W2T9_9EURO|nr:gluconate 5-dehydrogenase [Cladophialophora yegresii CBS 114405]EXJ62362.1 gluconate 5-dehydrogenase [Cladophialophora yegresii CBS 114405]
MNTSTTYRVLRHASRRVANIPRTPIASSFRPLSTTTPRALRPTLSQLNKDDPYHKASTEATGTSAGPHEGSASRTDREIVVEYPPEEDFPQDRPLRGRGGVQYVKTLPTFSLEGRTAVVTGGARGLGLVMGQALVQSGADLAIVDLNREEAEKQAQELMSLIAKENKESGSNDPVPKVTAHYADVSDPTSVNECIADIIGQHGKIDHLVTSAGFTENFSAETYPYERIKKLWGVNVDGTYLFSTSVARHLMERNVTHGSIVMIGSMSGSIVNVPQPQAPYNAAKAAVRHLAASFAVEWAHAHIRVNCISPGYMLTALTRKILDDNPELNKTWTSLIPVGKMGSPEDLQGAVVYLLSDASRYVTGADLRVDGG